MGRKYLLRSQLSRLASNCVTLTVEGPTSDNIYDSLASAAGSMCRHDLARAPVEL